MRFDTEAGTMVNPGDVFSRSFDYFGRTAQGPRGSSFRTLPADAFQWLRNNKDKKFFLWIGSGLIHMPYAVAVPAPYKTMFDPPGYIPFWKRFPLKGDEFPSASDPSYEVFSRVHDNEFFRDFSPAYRLTQEDVDYVNGRYDAGVYYTDLFIGELMKQLEALHLTEKTLVIIQSIHGEDLGEKGEFFHYDVSDAVMKNALIMRFPQGEYSGKRITEQVQGIDIMPTVLSYLDIPVNHESQGNSLLPLIQGDKVAPASEFAFIDRTPWWEYTLSKWYLELQNARGTQFTPVEEARLDEYQKMLKATFDKLGYPPGDIAIRSNDWKLIVRKNKELLEKVSWWGFITGKKQHVEEMELYDLKNDPGEKKNVVMDHPDVVARLKKKLLEWDESIKKQTSSYKKHDKSLIIPYP
jgi:arylsulfatase A-like enzyme